MNFSRRCFFVLGGKPLKDIKTREYHDEAELPKTLCSALKELVGKKLIVHGRKRGKNNCYGWSKYVWEIFAFFARGAKSAGNTPLCSPRFLYKLFFIKRPKPRKPYCCTGVTAQAPACPTQASIFRARKNGIEALPILRAGRAQGRARPR